MRGLSLNQPYASLVACGLKTIETRKTRIAYRGPVVICSTLNIDYDAWAALRLTDRQPICTIMNAYDAGSATDLPLGKALAVVDLVDCRALHPSDVPKSFFYDSFRWAWILENVKRFGEPMQVRGMQGLFPLPTLISSIAEAARARL